MAHGSAATSPGLLQPGPVSPGLELPGGARGTRGGAGPAFLPEAVRDVLGVLRELHAWRYLLMTFVRADVRQRYTGSVVGVYWSVLNQLVQLVIYTFVFSMVLNVEYRGAGGPLNYALYLVCGMVPWFAIQESVTRCARSVIARPELVQIPRFPLTVLPAHVVLTHMLYNVVALLLVLVAVWVSTGTLYTTALWLPVVLLVQLLLTLGIGFLVAALNVTFRDVEQVVTHVMLIWMFLTPVFYPSAKIPVEFEWVLVANPLAHLVDIYRELIMNGAVPTASFLTLTAYALVFFVVGLAVFRRGEPEYADHV